MSYCYGPVPSRRLGFSLGVDLLAQKICSFDCRYCQLGAKNRKTLRRFWSVNLAAFKAELKKAVKGEGRIDCITISGCGEPTLHRGLNRIIAAIKKVSNGKFPVCVITNSSLLYRKAVRKELKAADLIIPSLDAPSTETFRRINRPVKGATFNRVVSGLMKLRREFKGKIWLEIMLVGGINDSRKAAKQFKSLIQKIKPDKVQLNLPVRPASARVEVPRPEKVKAIKKILAGSCEVVVSKIPARKKAGSLKDIRKAILAFLRARPARLRDLMSLCGANPNEVAKQFELLLGEGLVKVDTRRKTRYFVIND